MLILPLAAVAFAVAIAAAWEARRVGEPVPKKATAALILSILTGIGVMLLLPTLGRPRPAANRIKCANNIRQIGIAIKAYADADPTGHMPPDLATLAEANRSDSNFDQLFVEPQFNGRSERAGLQPTTQWSPRIVPGSNHCDYFYVPSGGRFDALRPAAVVLIEPLDAHENAGLNVLYGDGHVDWLDIRSARLLLGRLLGGHNPP